MVDMYAALAPHWVVREYAKIYIRRPSFQYTDTDLMFMNS